jgi:hypothetical protein
MFRYPSRTLLLPQIGRSLPQATSCSCKENQSQTKLALKLSFALQKRRVFLYLTVLHFSVVITVYVLQDDGQASTGERVVTLLNKFSVKCR